MCFVLCFLSFFPKVFVFLFSQRTHTSTCDFSSLGVLRPGAGLRGLKRLLPQVELGEKPVELGVRWFQRKSLDDDK